MKRVFIILIVLLGLFAAIPISAYSAPDIGIWPSYGGDFEVFNVEQGSGPSDTRKVWIKNEGTSDLTVTAISSPNTPFSLVNPPTVPFTLTPGEELDINVQFSPVNQGSYSSKVIISSNDADEPKLDIPLTGTADEDPVTISPGDFVTGEIKVILADTDIFYFYGKQHDTVHITTANQKTYTTGVYGFYPSWELYGPDGKLIDSAQSGSKAVTLPTTGTYSILIRSLYSDATGQYGLNLNGVSDSIPSGKNIDFADTIIDETETMGDTDTFLFNGVQNDTIYITTANQKTYTTGVYGFYPSWELYGPDGKLIDSAQSGSKAVTLPTTGTYSILIRSLYSDATGQYGLSLQCISCTKLRYEEDDPAIGYTGKWYTYNSNDCSGGALKYSGETFARAYFSFNGTGIKWIVTTEKRQGKARAYLDGTYLGMVDLYSPNTQYQVVLEKTGLSPGNHTVTVEVSGQKNSSSKGYYINIDAFEIVP